MIAWRGHKVLIADLDSQASQTVSLGWRQPDELPVTIATQLAKIVENKPFEPREGILRHDEGVDLIPSSIELSGIEMRMVSATLYTNFTHSYSWLIYFSSIILNVRHNTQINGGIVYEKINQYHTEKIKTIINSPWAPDGSNFSEKIWKDRKGLVDYLNTELTQAFIRGENADRLIKEIKKKFGVSSQNAARLIQTESAFFSAMSKLRSYKELGYKKYVIVAVMDAQTSQVCRDMDGEVFDIEDFLPGATANPFHPRCRTTTAPYMSTGDEKTAPGMMRDHQTGKMYTIPRSMTYNEWKEKYVDVKDEDSESKILINPSDFDILGVGGGDMINTGASGAIPRADIKRQSQHAKLFYEEVRKRKGDIAAISKNTGFSIEDVEKIKNHMFFNKYDLGDEQPSCFDPDYDMVVSWQRLTEGKAIQEMDIVMLNHELMEYELMSEKGLSYREAHKITEKIYDYAKYIRELNRKEGLS